MINLTKDISAKIKGIAIILMIMTHTFSLFGAKSNFFVLPLLNTGTTFEAVLGRSAVICVYLFAFISGYGLFHSYKSKDLKSIFLLTITKIVQFLLCIGWLFLLFTPLFILFIWVQNFSLSN